MLLTKIKTFLYQFQIDPILVKKFFVENICHILSIFTIVGSKAEIQSITFDGCSEFPCIVHQGETATGKLTMKANSATDTLTCKVALVTGDYLVSILCFRLLELLWVGLSFLSTVVL